MSLLGRPLVAQGCYIEADRERRSHPTMGDIGKQTHIIEYEPLHHDGPECEDCQRPVTADEVTESLASPARRILCEKDTPSADEVTA